MITEAVQPLAFEMAQAIFDARLKDALRAAVRFLRLKVGAEACSLLQLCDLPRDELTVVAEDIEPGGNTESQAREIPIHRDAGGGLTGYLFTLGGAHRFNQKELRTNRFVRSVRSARLPSGVCKSLLSVPLSASDGNLLGLLKLENKRGWSRNSRPSEFTSKDEALALAVGRLVTSCLQNADLPKALTSLRGRSQRNLRLRILRRILEASFKGFNPTQDNFAPWNAPANDVLTAALCAFPCETTHKPGIAGVRPNIIRLLGLLRQSSRIVVEYSAPGGEALEEDFPVFFVRLKIRKADVLAFSKRITNNDPSLHERQLRRQIEGVAECLSELLGGSRKISAFVETVEQTAVENAMKSVLQAICLHVGFGCGIIYTYDKTQNALRCTAYNGTTPSNFVPGEFAYRIADNSAATWVFNNQKRLFARHPEKDPRVNSWGLSRFRINTPLFGFPILHSGECIGSIVLWQQTRSIATKDLKTVRHLCSHAGRLLAVIRPLQDTAQIYSSCVECFPLPIFRKNVRGFFTYGNRKFLEDTGATLEKLQKSKDAKFYPATLAKEYTDTDKEVLRTKMAVERVERHISSSRRRSHVKVHKMPIWDSSGNVVGVQGVFLNVSDVRKGVREEIQRLRAQRETHRSFLERVPDIIYSHDANGRLLSMNRSGMHKLGITRGDLDRGRSILDLAVPAESHKLRSLLAATRRFVSSRRFKNQTRTVMHGFGRNRVFLLKGISGDVALEVSVVAVRNADGTVVVHGIGRDITLAIEQEESRRTAEKNFRATYETSPVPMCRIEIDGKYSALNDAFRRLLGASNRSELQKDGFWQFFARIREREKLKELMRNRDLVRYSFQARCYRKYSHETAKTKQVEAVLHKLRNQGRIVYEVALNDVTERNERARSDAHLARVASNRERELYLQNQIAILRHHPVNQLSAISQWLEESREHIRNAESALAEIKAIEGERLTKFDLNDLILGKLSRLALTGIKPKRDLGNIPLVVHDKVSIGVLLGIFLENAYKHSSNKRIPIEVSTMYSHAKQQIHMRIRNAGSYKASDSTSETFTRQIAQTKSGRMPNEVHGLGLTIAAGILSRCGGSFVITNHQNDAANFVVAAIRIPLQNSVRTPRRKTLLLT